MGEVYLGACAFFLAGGTGSCPQVGGAGSCPPGGQGHLSGSVYRRLLSLDDSAACLLMGGTVSHLFGWLS